MITCLGEEGFFSFYAHRVRKASSPDLAPCMEGSLSRFNLTVSSSDALTLKESSLIKSYVQTDNYLATLALSSLFEIAIKLLDPDDAGKAFGRLQACLKAISEKKDPMTLVYLFLAYVLKLSGYGLEVDGCAMCGAKEGIVAFKPEEGGFLCTECASALGAEPLPAMQLKMHRFAFRCDEVDFGRVDFPMEHLRPALTSLTVFAEDCTGVKLSGINQFLRY